MKFIILVICVVAALSVNIRKEQKEASLVQTTQENCVTVYEKCHFEGASTSVCDHGQTDFNHPIHSAQVPDGMAISVTVNNVEVHVQQNLKCLSKPLNPDGQTTHIQGTTVAELEQKYGKWQQQ